MIEQITTYQETTELTRLAELANEESAVITRIMSHDVATIQKLMALGVIPGMAVTMLQRFPSFLFQVGHTQIAVDHSIAATVEVSRTKD